MTTIEEKAKEYYNGLINNELIKKSCCIDLNSIFDIGIVNGVCAIEYNDLTIMITRQ